MTSPATVTSVTISPASGVEHVGDTVTFTIAFDSAITVSGGTPTLTLNDGGTAVYDAAATAALGDPSRLVFTYKVATSDLSVTGLSFVRGDQNGAAIFDNATGQGPDFTNLFAASFPGIQVATPPTAVTSIVATPTNVVEHAGDVMTFTIAFSRAIVITGGTPTLTLSNGGTASYDAAATAALGDPSRLVFTYTVGASDTSVVGLSFVRGDQNGAVIVDPSGRGPDFTSLFATSFPNVQVSPHDAGLGGAEINIYTTPLGSPTGIGTQLTTLPNGNYIVTWNYGAQVFAPDGGRIGAPILSDKSLGSPVVTALPDGGFVVAWLETTYTPPTFAFSVKAQMFDADGTATSSEIPIKAATVGGLSLSGITALSNGGFVVTWTDSSQGAGGATGDSSGSAVKAQLFAADGSKTGSEILVNTVTYNSQYAGSVTALSNGGFIVTWSDASGGVGDVSGNTSPAAAKAQLFAADGTRLGGEILLSAQSANKTSSEAPTFYALANGGFAAVWSDITPTPAPYFGAVSNERIQLFAEDGTKVGAQITMPATTAKGSFTALSNGGFVLTWGDSVGDGSGASVRAQIFASDGTKIGTEILVNTATYLDQKDARITALSDGGFVVTWQDGSGGVGGAPGDTDGWAVKAQIFAGDGTRVGSEFLVNVTTPDHQIDPNIVALDNGRFAVTWTNWISDISPSGPTGKTTSYALETRVFDPSPDVTTIAAGTTLDIAAATAARLAFADGGAALQLDHSTAFIGQINGFGGGDTIDLRDVAFSAGTTLGYRANANNSGGTLTVSDGTHVTALALLGQYSAASFAVGSDGHGGTVISSATAAAEANSLAAPHA